MLYALAHIIRGRMGWLWDFVEQINSGLFSVRYGRRLRDFSFTTVPEGYEVMQLRDVPTERMVVFFGRQPEEAFTYFRPHGFDGKSIQKLQKSRAFLAYVLLDKEKNEIAGYCFNRSFLHGIGFRGRMVDINYRGKGLGTAMNRMLNEVGFGIGLRLFETVSKDNVASYRSALAASNVKVVKELPDNEVYLEIVNEG